MDTVLLSELEKRLAESYDPDIAQILEREVFSLIYEYLSKQDELFEMNKEEYTSKGVGYWLLSVTRMSLEAVHLGHNIENLVYVPVQEGYSNPLIAKLIYLLDMIRSGTRSFKPESELIFAIRYRGDILWSVVNRQN